MLFGASVTSSAIQDRSSERWALLRTTIEVVQSCFPSIVLRLLDHVPAVNAQASRFNGEACVDIFGGFAFHPEVGADALKFTLLHEIGHHFGGGPRMSAGSKLACDCAADSWAILQGLALLAERDVAVDVELAMSQLEKALSPSVDSIRANQFQNENCWCWDWPRRKHHLSTGKVPALQCCFMFKENFSR